MADKAQACAGLGLQHEGRGKWRRGGTMGSYVWLSGQA